MMIFAYILFWIFELLWGQLIGGVLETALAT